MRDIVFTFIEDTSLLIGIIGILIIFVGAVRGFAEYLFCRTKDFQEIRLTLGSHLILGLDFLVCKDIIDTILLDSVSVFWQDLAALITVVAIRIILTHFAQREIEELKKSKIKKNQK